jgi:hypothetical protein
MGRKDLTDEPAPIEDQTELVHALENRLKAAEVREMGLCGELASARTERMAAQMGLVPYVRALEEFDRRLKKRPALRKQLEADLRDLGLWEIKVGYDPTKDVTRTVLSPNRT